MSLILGIYSKRHKIQKSVIRYVTKNFLYKRKGHIETYSNKNIYLCNISNINNEQNYITKSEDENIISILGGDIYNLDKLNGNSSSNINFFSDNENNNHSILLELYKNLIHPG